MSVIKKVHAEIETAKDLIETIDAFLTIATPFDVALLDAYFDSIGEARSKEPEKEAASA